jgi:two-component system phosphate regulon sensor histidine kinase PhoR
MQDITRVRQLEQMRQDFVANVSHELKTPITSIKGFVETLLDGADADPKARSRFLGIIAKQAEHLNAIVADLLLLSSVEHQTRQHQITLETLPLLPVLESAVEVCNVQASAKQIPVTVSCPEDLTAQISPHLLEQAVTNLVENAIKYSEPGASVSITAAMEGPNVIIDVQDNGRGIEQRHLERLFERFYRVDKGRSRQLGGTGLGLSIVKHIALAHAGRITVKSALGEGSTFRLHLLR